MTIGPCTSKLLEISSEAICPRPPVALAGTMAASSRSNELLALYNRRNGFYTFESALHVFPACGEHHPLSLQQWNLAGTWKDCFAGAADGFVCFAEDIFGEQFVLAGDDIVRFNPESGESSFLASSLEEWACLMLTDYEHLSGYPLAHEWQTRSGALGEGQRLVPTIAFILGGEYTIGNLFAMERTRAMRYRGDMYRQLRDCPDGSRVKLVVRWDK